MGAFGDFVTVFLAVVLGPLRLFRAFGLWRLPDAFGAVRVFRV